MPLEIDDEFALCVPFLYWIVTSLCILHVLFLDQEERSRAVEEFKKGDKDVLVATDVASKGLDFEGIQHVINYDMPEDIENYGK